MVEQYDKECINKITKYEWFVSLEISQNIDNGEIMINKERIYK